MSGARVGEWGSFDLSHSQESSGVWRLSSVPRGGAEGGGTGSGPVALQGADVSVWTNLIRHLVRTSGQRLLSLRIVRDPTIGFRAQN